MWIDEHGKRRPTLSDTRIEGFVGEMRWLSNFSRGHVINMHGFTYDNVEAAYQASKSENPEDHARFTFLTPAGAQLAGQSLEKRPNWDRLKPGYMMCALMQKWREDALAWHKLQKTKGKILVESNNWGDHYWGKDWKTGFGMNVLGDMTMLIREMPDPEWFYPNGSRPTWK